MSQALFVVSCNTVGAVKIFGSGTKLVVTNTPTKLDSKKIQILHIPTEQHEKVTYMCLIEDFYPNVIKVTWKENEKKAENAVYGEIWPSHDDKKSYSISSWLTIDKDRSKNYRCTYQHERKEDSVPITSQGSTRELQTTTYQPPITIGCINNPENSTIISAEFYVDTTVSFMHRTAYLIYIVLLLKSTMYYVIVLFFMYRMRRRSKRYGKKP